VFQRRAGDGLNQAVCRALRADSTVGWSTTPGITAMACSGLKGTADWKGGDPHLNLTGVFFSLGTRAASRSMLQARRGAASSNHLVSPDR